MKELLVWHKIDDDHCIARVPGGWMFKTTEEVTHISHNGHHSDGWDWRTSVTFIPDPTHMYEDEWFEFLDKDCRVV